MTYNTNNSVPSVDVRDLYDNAQNLDNLVNGALPAYADRLGVSRKSYKGMELDFSAFLAASGFELPALEYVDGSPLVVARPTQLIERDGILYSVKPSESFPATLTGTWATDELRVVVRADQDLRQDLANQVDPAKGAALIGYDGATLADTIEDIYSQLSTGSGVAFANSISDMRNLDSGDICLTRGYAVPGDGGHGVYRFDPTDTTSIGDAITIFASIPRPGRWKLLHNGSINIEQTGAKNDGSVAINADLIRALAVTSIREVKLGKGPYLVSAATPIIFPYGKALTGIPGAGSTLSITGAGYVFFLSNLSNVSGLLIDCVNHTSGFIFALATSIGGIEYVTIKDVLTYHTKGFLTDEDHPTNVATNVRVSNVSNRLVKGPGFLLRDVFAFLEMRDVAVDYIGNASPQNFTGYSISNNEGCLLDNCEVTGTTGIVLGTTATQIGFNFTNCKAVYLRRSFADACGGRGFIFNACQYVRLSTCSTSLCDDAGVAFISSTDVQSTNLYSGGRRGIAGATASIPAVLVSACTRVQLGNTEAINATGDGILLLSASVRVVINGGILTLNGGRGITTNAGSVSLSTGVLMVGNTAGNYSLATNADHLVASQLASGALANVTGPGAG
jgi:hypothetical protein